MLIELLSADAQGPTQWVHLVPSGVFSGKDGRGPYRARDLPQLIEASQRASGGRPLPVDYDHQIDLAPSSGGRAPAAGWITKMEARADGLWGLVEWTPAAQASLKAREYRFLSPVFVCDGTGDVKAVVRAALTNNPNLQELTALNAAKGSMSADDLITALRKALSLDSDGDLSEILEAVQEATGKMARTPGDGLTTAAGAVDPSKYVPIALFQQAVSAANRANAGLSRQSAEAVVGSAIETRRLLPWMRDWAVHLCMINRPAFDEFVSGVGKPISTFIHSLGEPAVPGKNWGREESGEARLHGDPEVFTRLGLTADDVQKYGVHAR